ncbi:hypothetical protein ACFLYK_03815 [Candidatus Cloacimonadota bacterium]
MTRTRLDLLNTLIYRIDQSRQNQRSPFKIAIDGLDGAGKSYLACELYKLMKRDGYPVLHCSIDNFHNKKKIRYSHGKTSPEGYYKKSFNYKILLENLLIPLMKSDGIEIRLTGFDLKNDIPIMEEPLKVTSDTILILDGVFLSRPRLHKYWDLNIFIHTDIENILPRVMERDNGSEEELKELYLQKYIPGQLLYLDECRPHLNADILINNNNFDHPFFMVNSREKELFMKHTVSYFDRQNPEKK